MTGTIELSDQDVQDLVSALETDIVVGRGWRGCSPQQFAIIDATITRLESLKERLLKVAVNES